MRVHIQRVSIILVLIIVPLWSASRILHTYSSLDIDRILSSRALDQTDIVFVVHFFLLVTWVFMAVMVLASIRDFRTGENDYSHDQQMKFFRPAAWLMASMVIAPQSQLLPKDARSMSQEVPVGVVASPTIAAAVISYVLMKRREQLRSGAIPVRLSEAEIATLSMLQHQASKVSTSVTAVHNLVLPQNLHSDIRVMIDSIESTEPLTLLIEPSSPPDWTFVVKVFGFPVVEHYSGQVAIFRKKRSLELLTWLTMNRDRSRRSAARTAMWESNIHDSTFSTILSELRRALVEIEKDIPRQEWARPTFSDEIPLNGKIVTDAELLSFALSEFRKGQCDVSEVVKYLVWIRDVPFSGTSYSWADLDGTTTRLVILAVTAATEVAQWAFEHEKVEILNIAVGAGLRVMPGCEELLLLQTKALPTSRNPRAISVA